MNALIKNWREAAKVNKVFLTVILAMAVPARAAVVYFDTANPFVEPGETISVNIFSDVETGYIRMDQISDDGGGTAANLYLNPGYDYSIIFDTGTIINNGGVLIEGVEGSVTTGSPTVSGILYSFDYTVSLTMMPGNIINIFADSSNGAINEVDVIGMIENVIPDSLSLTVVPEPGTLFLLGLGAMFLRKIRQRN
jgi:hypothetical protein